MIKMLLAIDVGNTHIVLGFLEGEEIKYSFRLTTRLERSSDEFGLLFMQFLGQIQKNASDLSDVIVCSVVPTVMHSLTNGIMRYLHREPIVVDSEALGIKILYDNPGEVGMDRLVNTIAGTAKYGTPLILIDFGTATTFCAINKAGEYLGGVISPGIQVALDALVNKTSKLPRVEIVRPKSVVGRNTVSSMQSGLYFGLIGQVDTIVSCIEEETGTAQVVATGGLARLIAADSKKIQHVDRNLTLDGLRIIYDRMQN